MIRRIALSALSIVVVGSSAFAQSKSSAKFDMTWEQVFNARSNIISMQHEFMTQSRGTLKRGGEQTPYLHADTKEQLLVIADGVVKKLRPYAERLDSYENRFNSNDVESFVKYIVLQSAYYATATSVVGHIDEADSLADSLRSERQDARVAEFLKINASVARQIDKQSEGSSPTVRAIIEEGKSISKKINQTFDVSLRSAIFEALNEDLDAFVSSQDEFQKIYASKIVRRTPIMYSLQAALLSASSDIYVPRDHYITDQMVDQLEPQFEPGDIALIRHKYKLTNIGIKGAWAHSLMIIEAPSKLFPFFDTDADTTLAFRDLCANEKLECSNFSTYLRARYPKAYTQYVSGDLYRDRPTPFAAIESKKDGVIFSNIYEAIRKDQLTVLRPNLSKKDRALAVAKAFGYIGRKYDYGFDLKTDERMICTELLVYSYQPIPSLNKDGIDFHISHRGKTPLVYPEDIVKTFSEGRALANPPLNMVVYLRETAAGKTMESADSESLARTAAE